jgi:hypothetical protein
MRREISLDFWRDKGRLIDSRDQACRVPYITPLIDSSTSSSPGRACHMYSMHAP